MPVIAAIDRDGHSETVLREAAKLADAFDQELHAVHVLDRSAFVALERTSVEDTGQSIEPARIRDIAGEVAAELVDDSGLAIEYTPVGVFGDPAKEVIRYAREHDAEYIVVGGRQRSPVGKVLFGSVTQSVLLNAPCAVVTAIGASGEGGTDE